MGLPPSEGGSGGLPAGHNHQQAVSADALPASDPAEIEQAGPPYVPPLVRGKLPITMTPEEVGGLPRQASAFPAAELPGEADFPDFIMNVPESEIDSRYNKDLADSTKRRRLNQQGANLVTSHYIERHGPDVSDEQLEMRARWGIDPITGTPKDGEHGQQHNVGRVATKFNSKRSLYGAIEAAFKSDEFRAKAQEAVAGGKEYVTVSNLTLISIFGPSYRRHVTGMRRIGALGSTVPLSSSLNKVGSKHPSKLMKLVSGNW